MRITQAMLHKFARQSVKMRTRSEPDLHSAYLVGSLLSEEPLLGGSTDIDLILVHKYQAPVERECVAITPEVSLDIFHKVRDDYEQHRELRQDPLIGYPLTYNHILLFDTAHWLEFIQSSVTAEFHRADNVLSRVNIFSSAARENWFSLVQTPSKTHQEWLHRYLEILALGANAVSGLIGPPLTTRRFMKTLKDRLDTLGVPKVMAGFRGLLGFTESQGDKLPQWIDAFEEDLDYLNESTQAPVHLTPCRHAYYLDGIRALAESEDPAQASWPLLRTWLEVRLAAPQPSPNLEIWESCLADLNLTEDNASQQFDAVDAFLDNVEIVIESWAEAYGI